MDEKIKIVSPRYQQIATDIASKIANGKYKQGDKIFARSAIASEYGVSPETARRAICILSDMNIVEATKGSGVIITSCENAIKFIKQYTDIQTVNELKNEILKTIHKQEEENKNFKTQIIKLIDKTDRLKSINPFVPFEISINELTPYLGKNLSEINFWHNTSATVIAIKRSNSLMMSPGPYAVLTKGDVLYFVGDENCYDRVNNFIYP
ncbi:MAG: TrkA C-terminal domain-containing protein [Oscillospiraceae bacterium]